MQLPAAKCPHCTNPVEDQETLCGPCGIELAHYIMNAEPDPMHLECEVCKAPFSLLEARVLRAAKNPHGKLPKEPAFLCWTCTRLFHSARQTSLQ